MCCTILYLVFITKKTLIQSGSKKWVKTIETDSKIVSKSPKLYTVQAYTYYIKAVLSVRKKCQNCYQSDAVAWYSTSDANKIGFFAQIFVEI